MISLLPAFEKQMIAQLGDNYPRFQASLSETPTVALRTNPLKVTSVQRMERKVGWCKTGYYLDARPSFTYDPLFHAGTYYVQEASSMFLEQAVIQTLDLNQPLCVLDLCGAPGGKTTHLLSLINEKSLMVSNEVIHSRASILSENVQKWGYSNVVVTNNDPANFSSLTGFFDLIVVDAPCSGEGLFRKDPDAMAHWSEENITLCARRQQRILSNIWPALKENGILIYSTCTFNTIENEDNLKWLRSNHQLEFAELALDQSWGIKKVNKDGVLGYRFYPHLVEGEGFFISIIRKKESSGEKFRMAEKKNKKTFPSETNKILSKMINSKEPFEIVQKNDLAFLYPTRFENAINHIASNFKTILAGTLVAGIKNGKIIPDHALAISTFINKDQFQIIDLSLEDSITYLKKETLSINGEKGIALITYKGTGLGWVNILENRVNNLYPVNWRIRMRW